MNTYCTNLNLILVMRILTDGAIGILRRTYIIIYVGITW